ncbi:hypothetical protein [Phenylobacterium sp.]|uniref:hypothetical protein n=1 Tax=Phenylobacterium sp. TaxID=1871053 RepID=UPI0025FF91B7|nr:hypothetical protein [Phenylobacterium sp.]
MSDLDTGAAGTPSRKTQAKELVGQAGQALKAEAQSFASVAQDRVRAEAQKGAQAGAKTLGDFANAVRRAGDELAGADQSPASRLVQQAADGLESLSRNLADKEPGDLLNAVRGFGRRNPAAFIGGAVLVGLALGRFARASEPDDTTGLGEPMSFAPAQDDTPPTFGTEAGGIEAPIAANLGALEATPSSASPVGLEDEGVSGTGETDATGGLTDAPPADSPHAGGR